MHTLSSLTVDTITCASAELRFVNADGNVAQRTH